MSDSIVVYEKSTCSKCRETKKLLREAGVDFETVHYYDTHFTEAKLQSLLNKLDMEPMELIRRGEEAYKKYKIGTLKYSNNELVKLMVKNPDLIQRPIVEVGDRAVLGRPPLKVRELL